MSKEKIYGAKAKISFYVKPDEKQKVKELARQSNRSVSEIYNQITKQLLDTNPVEFTAEYSKEEKKEFVAGVRLTKGEYERLHLIAETEGMSASSYISYVLRGFFTSTAFTHDQVFYLERILGQLGKLGSNINQIVKILRQKGGSAALEKKYLLEMLKILQEERNILLTVVKNNHSSWQNVKK